MCDQEFKESAKNSPVELVRATMSVNGNRLPMTTVAFAIGLPEESFTIPRTDANCDLFSGDWAGDFVFVVDSTATEIGSKEFSVASPLSGWLL